MQISAELRWFWNTPQDDLRSWFCNVEHHSYGAGGGGKRIDSYLLDEKQTELGLKHRGGRYGVEIKGLVSVTECGGTAQPFVGAIELWTKWTSSALVLDNTKTIFLEKQRWIRDFDTSDGKVCELQLDDKEMPLIREPDHGCSVEFTQVRFLNHDLEQTPGSDTWWTLSLESYGDLSTVHQSLKMVTHELASRNPPRLDTSYRASYPVFLRDHAPVPCGMTAMNK